MWKHEFKLWDRVVLSCQRGWLNVRQQTPVRRWLSSSVSDASRRGALACVLLLAAASVQAQNVGDRVSLIERDVEVKSGNNVVDEVGRGQSFTVQEVQGEWIRINSRHPGWILKRQVIPTNQAVGHFTRAIQADPHHACLYFARANAWTQAGEHDNAIDDYTKCIRLRHTPLDCDFTNRGQVFLCKQEYEMAIADFSDALRLDVGPKSRSIDYSNRGRAFHGLGKYEKAISDFSDSIRLDPEATGPYEGRAWSYAVIGEFGKALADCEKEISLNSKNSGGYVARAYVLNQQGQFGPALADYAEAIRLDPKNAANYNLRAWLLATCPQSDYRDGARAVEDAKRACELSHWKDRNNLDTLAAACAEAGNFQQAVQWQTKALSMNVGKDREDYAMRLELYHEGKPYRDIPKNKRA